MRFLLVSHDAGGTVPPMIAVVEELVGRGHDVAVLGQPSIRARAEAAGGRFSAFSTIGDYRRDSPLEDQLELIGPAMTGPEPGDDLLAAVDELAPDAVVVDCNLAGVAAAAESAGVPSALLLHSMYVTYVDTWFGEVWPFLEPAINVTRERYGLDPCASWTDLFERHRRLYSVVPAAFDAPVSRPAPPAMRHVGFLVPASDAAAVDHDRPAVLVSIGTTDQGQRPLLQAILDAIGAMAVTAIVTTAGQGASSGANVPPNVVVRDFVPHGALLPHIDAVVSHAGLGTVAAALSHGVPMVCTPIARDQPVNADRVVALGAGEAVDAADATAAAIAAVLDDPRYRDGAAAVGDASRAAGGVAAVADDLERLSG